MNKIQNAKQMTTPMALLIPQKIKIMGFEQVSYIEAYPINVNFKTYGGTESVNDGVMTVLDTAQITCWYDPNIKSSSQLKRLTDGAIYEVIGEPENLEQRNMILTFKVKRIKGGA